jgi:hypothetical protein
MTLHKKGIVKIDFRFFLLNFHFNILYIVPCMPKITHIEWSVKGNFELDAHIDHVGLGRALFADQNWIFNFYRLKLKYPNGEIII